ncbi:MAG TPA: nitroreductase [Steroidobacteraceae bacterium]|nr:nitroreductase [Steroidobacteraceae bacterium]
MDLIEAITTRASAAHLVAPGPSPEHLALLLDAANRAPDHGRLTPWRILVLDGPTRIALATAVGEARRRREPAVTEEQLQKERDKFLRAPTLLVVGCVVRRDFPKVPEIEQVLATGAAAENLFLAAHALGYGVMWRTGPAAYEAAVKTAAGLRPEDHIAGFMHLGTREP